METALWNELELKQPPTFTCKLTSADVSFKDLRKLSDVCWSALTTFQNQDLLYTEAATLSRLIYRMKSMFRGDKGFKSIEKINHCLRNFLSLNLASMYDNLFRTIPSYCSDKEIYCPTRQMLEYVLLRTQGLAALLCRIVHTCLEAASFFRSRINSGHNWQVSLLCLGAVSRIWALTRHLLNSCAQWYQGMVPFINVFHVSGPIFLPEGYIFPTDLQTWLSIPGMDATSIVKCESNMDKAGEPSQNSSNKNKSADVPYPTRHSMLDDVGVSISRESVQNSSSFQQNSMKGKERAFWPSFSNGKEDENVHQDEPMNDIKSNMNNSEIVKNLTRMKTRREKLSNEMGLSDKNTEHSHKLVKSKKNFDEGHPFVLESKQKAPKNVTALKLISSLKSQDDVQRLLKNESKKRSITSPLGDDQWKLLKGVIGKLNTKFKKTDDEKKKKKILDQIKKAFKIALL